MGQRVPILKMKITVGPFANGQTRVLEYSSPLPVMIANDKAELRRKFGELFEQLEVTIDENMGTGRQRTENSNTE